MTTQSSLQYSVTFTQSHTHSYSASISSTLLFYEAQFGVCSRTLRQADLLGRLGIELPTFRLEDNHSTPSATAAGKYLLVDWRMSVTIMTWRIMAKNIPPYWGLTPKDRVVISNIRRKLGVELLKGVSWCGSAYDPDATLVPDREGDPDASNWGPTTYWTWRQVVKTSLHLLPLLLWETELADWMWCK